MNEIACRPIRRVERHSPPLPPNGAGGRNSKGEGRIEAEELGKLNRDMVEGEG